MLVLHDGRFKCFHPKKKFYHIFPIEKSKFSKLRNFVIFENFSTGLELKRQIKLLEHAGSLSIDLKITNFLPHVSLLLVRVETSKG